MSACTHPRESRFFAVVICKDGRRHIAEWCRLCGGNARGTRWVPAEQVPDNVADLPVIADYRDPVRRGEQKTLFPEC